MTLLWCAFGALALAQAALADFYNQIGVLGEQVSVFTKIGITITGLYLFCIGGIMQFFPKLGAKKSLTAGKPDHVQSDPYPRPWRSGSPDL